MTIGTLVPRFTIDLVLYPSQFIGIGGGHPTNMFVCVVIIGIV